MKPRWSLRMTLRRKTAFVSGGSALLVAIILTLAFFLQMRSLMSEELQARARTVGIGLANNLAFATFSGDKVGLDAAAEGALRDLPDTAYVVFRGEKGEVLSKKVHSGLPPEFVDKLAVPNVPDGTLVVEDVAVRNQFGLVAVAAPVYIEEKKAGSEDIGDPLMLGEQPAPTAGAESAPKKRSRVGLIQYGVNTSSLEAKVSMVTSRALVLGVIVIVLCAIGAVLLARLITVSLERLTGVASGIARGDLTQKIEVTGDDEIAKLADSFETMSSGLRSMVTDLQVAAGNLQSEASVIFTTASQQAAMASQHAASIQETSTTATEIAQTSQMATEYADSVIKVTERANELSQEGQKVVEESVSAIEKLGEQVEAIATTITDLLERSVQIGDIITTVKDVAEQSNLLALNASIEAAKAGENGRGFAVVAMEMRALAEQSKGAAGQVRAILSEVQKGTRAAVEATEEGSRRAKSAIALAEAAGKSIDGLMQVSRESSTAARQIATNTRQQTLGVEHIVSAIDEQSRAMNEAVEGTQQIQKVAGGLSDLAGRLNELVGRYRVGSS